MTLPVEAVVVTWQSAATVSPCLESARREGAAGAVVVDNASTDGSADAAAQAWPAARTVRLRRNVGFARAANLGLSRTATPFALLLNPDARLAPGALSSLLEDAAAHPRAGLFSPLLVDEGGRPQAMTARRPPTLLDRLSTDTLAASALSSMRALRREILPIPREAADVPVLCGACLLVRRSAMEEAGALDPRFFLYFEDVDWCLRMRAAGWACRVVPAARAIHVGGASAARAFSRSYAENLRSEILYFRKHLGVGMACLMQACRAADLSGRIALDLARLAAGRDRLGRRPSEYLKKDAAALAAALSA